MKVLVTGAGGMLGRDVMLAAGNAGHDVVGFGHTELDVTDAAAVEAKLDARAPRRGHQLRRLDRRRRRRGGRGGGDGGQRRPAPATSPPPPPRSAPASSTSPATTSSTAAKGAPYVETDQPAPLSAYGRTKLAGEEATAAANKRHFVVRSSWLFGIGGGNFVETMLRLAADHGEVLVVRDQVGSPTYTWHLAYGIVRLIEGIEYGIHHMAAAGACSWYEFAREIFEQAKVECKVLSATTEMLGRPAPRPRLLGPGQPARARDRAALLAGRPGRLPRPAREREGGAA